MFWIDHVGIVASRLEASGSVLRQGRPPEARAGLDPAAAG
jgi:hypothetical protein